MSDLTEFLLARIAEDEYEAEVCLEQYRRGDGGTTRRWLIVLAESKAKRRIIEVVSAWKHQVVEDCWYTCGAATEGRDGGECCDDARSSECDCGLDDRREKILISLAKVYADDPNYRDEWTP